MANTQQHQVERRLVHIKYAVAVIILAAALFDIHYTPKTVTYSTDVIVLFGLIFYLVFAGLRRIRIVAVRAAIVALIMGSLHFYRPMQWSTVAIFSLVALF